MGIYGSSGRRADPLSHLGLVVGLASAALGGLLWLHRFQPNSRLLGRYAVYFVPGPTQEQIQVLAATLGAMAVIAGIGASLQGRGRASSVLGLLLGVFGLSFPVLSYLNVIARSFGSPL